MTLSWTSRPHRQVVYSFRFWVDAVVDVWFILDVLVNFRTSFEITEGSNRGKLEISRKVRDRAALHSWQARDATASLLKAVQRITALHRDDSALSLTSCPHTLVCVSQRESAPGLPKTLGKT